MSRLLATIRAWRGNDCTAVEQYKILSIRKLFHIHRRYVRSMNKLRCLPFTKSSLEVEYLFTYKGLYTHVHIHYGIVHYTVLNFSTSLHTDSPPPEPDVVIGFNATEYTVEESDGSVSVTVELVVFGREFPPLSLLVTTEDGTAIGTLYGC